MSHQVGDVDPAAELARFHFFSLIKLLAGTFLYLEMSSFLLC